MKRKFFTDRCVYVLCDPFELTILSPFCNQLVISTTFTYIDFKPFSPIYLPFYVGKGAITRGTDHIREAKSSKNGHKLNKIRKIVRMIFCSVMWLTSCDT